MKPPKPVAIAQLVLLAVCLLPAIANAQDHGSNGNESTGTGVAQTKLYLPVYPPLALQARIAGDVKLQLAIRQDGSVVSAEVLSGHPLLWPSAVESAKKSAYECRGCSEAETPYSLTYTFKMRDDGDCCNALSRTADVTESNGRITISAPAPCLCDPVSIITRVKVRSAKCLYLWKCGLDEATDAPTQ